MEQAVTGWWWSARPTTLLGLEEVTRASSLELALLGISLRLRRLNMAGQIAGSLQRLLTLKQDT